MKNSTAQCDVSYVHRDRVASARKAIPDNNRTWGLSETFKVLSDPTRLKIVVALAKEELCVCDIAALLKMTDSAISHQLRVLRSLRLVRHRKNGKMVYYTLDDEHIEDLIRIAMRHVAEP